MWWEWQRLRLRLMLRKKIDIILTHTPPFEFMTVKIYVTKVSLPFPE